jgi:uncharacterized DUF497 family protein
MRIEFDVDKNEKNIQERGISFEQVHDIEWETAHIVDVTKPEYGERRWRVWGMIRGRLFVLIFTKRDNTMRVISLRKANDREWRKYNGQQETQSGIN